MFLLRFFVFFVFFFQITNGTLDVKKLMKTWILHKGFPLVTVNRKGKVISLHQEKFSYRVEPDNWTSDTR